MGATPSDTRRRLTARFFCSAKEQTAATLAQREAGDKASEQEVKQLKAECKKLATEKKKLEAALKKANAALGKANRCAPPPPPLRARSFPTRLLWRSKKQKEERDADSASVDDGGAAKKRGSRITRTGKSQRSLKKTVGGATAAASTLCVPTRCSQETFNGAVSASVTGDGISVTFDDKTLQEAVRQDKSDAVEQHDDADQYDAVPDSVSENHDVAEQQEPAEADNGDDEDDDDEPRIVEFTEVEVVQQPSPARPKRTTRAKSVRAQQATVESAPSSSKPKITLPPASAAIMEEGGRGARARGAIFDRVAQ